jgi:sugar phosphate isomerase/epimerase
LTAKRYRSAFADKGVSVDSVFGGLAAYTYPQLLAPFKETRDLSLIFFKRAVDLTLELGSTVLGTPVGGMSNNDANNPRRRAELYKLMIDKFLELALYAKERGLTELLVEATPLSTEFPHDPASCVKLMKDFSHAAVPVRLLLDWGHVLYRPLLGDQADMSLWLRECGKYVGSFHLQQTDGLLDRHWDFTKEGLLTAESIEAVLAEAGMKDFIQYLEVVPPFEAPDDEVLAEVKKSLEYLRSV